MFGRRSKPTPAPPVLDLDESASPALGAVQVDEIAADRAPLLDTPIRAEGSGTDSGLAEIEAEFTISDADLALLDLSSLAFDQLTNPLSPAEQKMGEDRSALDDFLKRLNDSYTAQAGQPVNLEPYFMIPERCWSDDHRQLLVDVLGLTPAQPWNILPLAGDASTATKLGVAPHPGPRGLDTRQLASDLIGDALDTMQASFEQATFGSDTVDTAALESAKTQAATEIKTIARRMAGPIVSTQAVDHARVIFFGD